MNSDIKIVPAEICNIVWSRAYGELSHIMRSAFLRDDRIEVILELADNLPITVFESLLLCGLTLLTELTSEEYIKMFKLTNEREAAFYNLTRFMLFHGGARRRTFHDLGADLSKLDSIGDVDVLSFVGENREEAKKRACKIIYDELNINPVDILKFKTKVSKF